MSHLSNWNNFYHLFRYEKAFFFFPFQHFFFRVSSSESTHEYWLVTVNERLWPVTSFGLLYLLISFGKCKRLWFGGRRLSFQELRKECVACFCRPGKLVDDKRFKNQISSVLKVLKLFWKHFSDGFENFRAYHPSLWSFFTSLNSWLL